MRIYLDDVRPLPGDFDVLMKHPEEVIAALKTGKVTVVSLDNDLGPGIPEGKIVAKWIEEAAFKGELKRLKVYVHTDNIVARQEMRMALRNAHRCWIQQEGIKR